MSWLAGRVALFLPLCCAWLLAASGAARASDIVCPQIYQPHEVRCDVSIADSAACARTGRGFARFDGRPSGQRLICEYAMLNEGYQGIFADQQRRLRAGTLRMNDVQAWRRKRDACTTVRCVDAVFAEWRRKPRTMTIPDARLAKAPESKPVQARPAVAPVVAIIEEVSTEPMAPEPAEEAIPDPAPEREAEPEPAPVAVTTDTVARPLPDIDPLIARIPRKPVVTNPSTLPAGATWVIGAAALLAAAGTGYWLARRDRASRYLDSVFAALAWLQTLPMLTFVLGGLALANGLLLVILLGGWSVHLPGIN